MGSDEAQSASGQSAQGNYIAQASGPGASASVRVIQPPDPVRALHQLPAAPADFTGRCAELAELQAAVETGGAVISGLVGLGGVGKTALATVLAQRLCDRYPDGQLFLNLQGTTEPLTPTQALATLIRAFEPEMKLPEPEAELRALYLSLLAGKRAIVLLDNAAGREQVAPLIPPDTCLLLVTSRVRFALPGLYALRLDALQIDEARDLILKIAPRVGEHADELALLCGYLPLALRAATSLLAVESDLNPRSYLAQLGDERRRLDAIGAEGVEHSVEAAFTLSFLRLPNTVADVFTRLSIFPADFDPHAEQEIAEDPEHRALSWLVRLSLVDYDSDRHRYRLHDLVRIFAQHRASPETELATRRKHATYYCELASAADDLYQSGGDHIARGVALVERDWPNIQAGQTWANSLWKTDEEAARLCVRYQLDSFYVLDLRQHVRERIHQLEIVTHACRRLADRRLEGNALGNLGNSYADLGDIRRAIEYHEQALVIAREVFDRRGEGAALGNLGDAYADLREFNRAIECYEKRLVITRELRDRRNEGVTLGNLGNAYANLGDARRAIDFYERSLDIARETGDRRGEATDSSNLGNLYASQGDIERALRHYEQALALARWVKDRRTEAASLNNLGSALRELGSADQAVHHFEQALSIMRAIDDRRGIGVTLGNIGSTYAVLGQHGRAIDYFDERLEVDRELRDRRSESATLGNLGMARHRLGDNARAIELYEEQLSVNGEIGNEQGTANTSLNLALLLKEQGRLEEALRHAETAAAFYERIGHPEYAQRTRSLVNQLRGQPDASGPVNDVLTNFGPLIDAVVAAAQGSAEARTAVEQAFEQLTAGGWMIAEPIQRIWAGERNAAALTQGLDESDTLIVGEIVQRLQP